MTSSIRVEGRRRYVRRNNLLHLCLCGFSIIQHWSLFPLFLTWWLDVWRLQYLLSALNRLYNHSNLVSLISQVFLPLLGLSLQKRRVHVLNSDWTDDFGSLPFETRATRIGGSNFEEVLTLEVRGVE